MCKIDDQCKLDAWSRVPKVGVLGKPRGMGWGGRWEEASGLGNTYVPMADSCQCMVLTQSLSCVQVFETPQTAANQLPCPSPTPGVCSNSCPSSRWCHPTISSSVMPFFSCHQSFPALGSFPISQFVVSGGQSIGVSASSTEYWISILVSKMSFTTLVAYPLQKCLHWFIFQFTYTGTLQMKTCNKHTPLL